MPSIFLNPTVGLIEEKGVERREKVVLITCDQGLLIKGLALQESVESSGGSDPSSTDFVQVKVSYQDKNGNGSDIRLHLCHHKTHKVPSTCTLQSFDSLLQKLDKYVPLGASVTDLHAGAGVEECLSDVLVLYSERNGE
ncbi:hypothetical protein L2E82_22983 [Cichorium intybus]|uniref:Uncharacterized protein n=1 Tax=Cichorium intybus TaxID=13427 RepID=A0ACB9DZH3_CICIN|nr:hypothetical protein L2E82_22983 [Cichorium intybus]